MERWTESCRCCARYLGWSISLEGSAAETQKWWIDEWSYVEKSVVADPGAGGPIQGTS